MPTVMLKGKRSLNVAERLLDELFDAVVKVEDFTFPTFRLVWKRKGLRVLHVIPFNDKKAGHDEVYTGMLLSLYRYLCEMLETIQDSHTLIWVVYALYTLYETQVVEKKLQIPLPMNLWYRVLDLKVCMLSILSFLSRSLYLNLYMSHEIYFSLISPLISLFLSSSVYIIIIYLFRYISNV